MVKTKTQIKHDFRIAFIFLLIGIIGTSIIWVYASTPSTFYIGAGKYPHGVSYTIWRESDTYYCKDAYGYTPSFGAGSTNGSYVLQSAVDVYGSKSIYLTEGTFVFDNVKLPDATTMSIEGEGKATRIRKSGSAPAIRVSGTNHTSRVRDVVIRDVSFQNYYLGCMLHLENCDRIYLENLIFDHYLLGAYAIYGENAWDVHAYALRFHGGGNSTMSVVYLYNGDINNCNNWRFLSCRWERRFEGIDWNTLALISRSWGSGSNNHNIHIAYSKIHGEPNASFTVGAIEFSGTRYSSITHSWICHHRGTIINLGSSIQNQISSLNFYNTATQGNFTRAIHINGTNNIVDNLLFNGGGCDEELIWLDSGSSYNFIDSGTIWMGTGYSTVPKVTDDGTGNVVRT